MLACCKQHGSQAQSLCCTLKYNSGAMLSHPMLVSNMAMHLHDKPLIDPVLSLQRAFLS